MKFIKIKVLLLGNQPWWLSSLGPQLSHSVDHCILQAMVRIPLETIIPTNKLNLLWSLMSTEYGIDCSELDLKLSSIDTLMTE